MKIAQYAHYKFKNIKYKYITGKLHDDNVIFDIKI